MNEKYTDTAFLLLCRHIRREHARELKSEQPFAADRAEALERAYAYAMGVAEDRGIDLPEIEDASGALRWSNTSD